jgi:beta-glucosidase/6-phospho-beta-glucosidase/beta-galactosidase
MPTSARPRQAFRRLMRRRDPLPSDFLFGVGTSDHQCEAFDPRFPDVWDIWEAEHPPGRVGQLGYVARGSATDFWQRYVEDVSLARQLGSRAFRFSIAWSRVEPEPGRFSDDALAHYRELAVAIRAAGMEPIITLMHFVWPWHVEQRGGLRAADFPAWFANYATKVRDALADSAHYWLTINEPNALILGYLKPFWMEHYAWPPGLPPAADDGESMRAAAEVIRNLFLAHRAARLVLRSDAGGERRLVSANSYYLGLPNRLWHLPIPLMRWVDWRATSESGWAEEDWALVEGRIVLHSPRAAGKIPRPGHLVRPGQASSTQADAGLRRRPSSAPGGVSTALAESARRLASLAGTTKTFAALFSFVSSNWWQLGMRGALPTFLCPPECRGQLDYVAFDYYFGTEFLHKIGGLLDVMERRYDRAPIWAGGLHDALRYFQAMFPHKPIFLIENGVAGAMTAKSRARYLRDHVRQVQYARQAGVNVIGHLAWSLTTNREWGLPSGPSSDFGLYHIDLDGDPTLTRRPTPAAKAYAAIIRHDGA